MNGMSNINGLGIGNADFGSAGASRVGGGTGSGGASFADALKGQIDEVSRMQQDATRAVNDLSTGKTDDVTGVMAAMEKSDLAFKTLLSIRSKLMEAYDEVKNIPL